jgi:MiaB-like tRNA modifying enzyme
MRIYLETYGCTANKSDESIILGILKKEGHKIVQEIEEAELLILLTCTVVDSTEQRMLSRLKEFRRTNKKIIVAGCMASAQPDLVKSIVPNAFLLKDIHLIGKAINGKDYHLSVPYFKDIIAPISIAQGCMLSCSYCITHIARGRLRSYPIHEILSNVRLALKMGCKEIQITAQDTASYGLDTGSNLGELLLKICEIKEDFRVRVGMMNPYTVQKNLENIILAYKNPKIYKFLHLPVQSGDNTILKKMNRRYTVQDFLRIINRFREVDVTLSTDIIVGFPTETEDQFNKSIDLIKTVEPDIVNITRYSARPMTKAKTMEGRIPTHVSKRRSKLLTDLCDSISREKNKKYVGKRFSVLVLEEGKKGSVIGRTDNYKPVVIREYVEKGKRVNVEIVDSTSTYLFGKLI